MILCTISKKTLFLKGDKLPKVESQFYQFVYVSQSKQIRGVSKPFQFKRAQTSDLLDEEDLTQSIQEEASSIKLKHIRLNLDFEKLKEIQSSLLRENVTLKNKFNKQEEELNKIKTDLKNKEQTISSQTGTITTLNKEKVLHFNCT